MDLHRVRRLAETLIASQLRSGRSTSDPRSFFGRPAFLAALDLALFLGAVGVAAGVVHESSLSSGDAAGLIRSFLPFLPIVALGVVAVAGLMFELTTTTKFAGSDAANWLPLSPMEYLLSSVAAISLTYSPAVALTLGAALPVAVDAGLVPIYVAGAVFSVFALVEGAILIEMVRAATQRLSSVSAGRRGQLSLVLRALVLVVVILLLQFAFNPVFLLGVAQHVEAVALVTFFVPFFWSTEALTLFVAGNTAVAALFTTGQLLFVGFLAYLASDLRERYWSPNPSEVRLESHRYAARNPVLDLLGLTGAESAIVTKDLKGLVRRREMLPTLVVPVVLAVLVVVEGAALGGFVSVLWAGWVAGFFALLLSGTSIGQERKALQSLYAFPLSPTNMVRAKAASVLLPATIVSLGLTLVVGLYFGLPATTAFLVLLLVLGSAVILTFWGLAFASRYSDFQERPRPQFMRPAGMLAATGSGMVLLFAILVPGTAALFFPSPFSWALGVVCAAFVVAGGTVAIFWTVTGFRQLFRELPF